KEVRTGGFLGLFSRKQIEVIAGLDTSAPRNHSPQEPKLSPLISQIKELSAAKAYTAAPSQTGSETVSQTHALRVIQESQAPGSTESANDRSIQTQSSNDPLYAEIRQMKEMMLKLS